MDLILQLGLSIISKLFVADCSDDIEIGKHDDGNSSSNVHLPETSLCSSSSSNSSTRGIAVTSKPHIISCNHYLRSFTTLFSLVFIRPMPSSPDNGWNNYPALRSSSASFPTSFLRRLSSPFPDKSQIYSAIIAVTRRPCATDYPIL